jgi:drug/metabolite transporter (DMT)-like permease
MIRSSSGRWRGFTSSATVALAGVFWAFVPVFLSSLRGYTAAEAVDATLIVNFAKFTVASVCSLAFGPRMWRATIDALRLALADQRSFRFLVIDGLAIAISNFLFIIALTRGNGAITTLILNSWPMIATAFLVRFIPQFRKISLSQIAGSSLALLGLLAIVFAGIRKTGAVDVMALGLAFAGAAGQGLVVVTHQRFLRTTTSDDWRLIPAWQAARNAVATAAVVVAALLTHSYAGPVHASTDLSGIWPLVLAGGFWTLSGALFHRGVSHSDNAFSTMPWLLAPLLSASLVAVAQHDSIPRSVFLGGVIILAANAMLSMTIEPPRFVTVLVATIVVVALLVLTLRGRNVSDYYTIGQTLGTFFAVTFGFLATRLHEQRTTAKLLEIRWRQRLAANPALIGEIFSGTTKAFNRKDIEERREIAEISAERASAQYLKQHLLPISEALMVTALAIGTCLFLVYCRPDNQVADLVSFLIVSSVVFSILLLWSNLVDTATAGAKDGLLSDSPNRMGEAVFGYLSALVAFVSIVAAILVGSTDWPTI